MNDLKQKARRDYFKSRYDLQIDKVELTLLILLGISLLVAVVSTLAYVDVMMSI